MLAIVCAALTSMTGGQVPAAAEPEPQIEIVCKTQALVRGARILIGDLVDILPPGEEAHRIGLIVFGTRPAAGFSRVVTSHEILQCMVMAGEDAGRLAMKGAREVVVQPGFTEITTQEIREAAETVLQAALAQEGGDVEFELGTRVRQLRVPPGRDGVDFKARVRSGQIGVARAIIDVSILVDDEVYKVIPLQYTLRRFQQVLQISKSIRKGEPLNEGNLHLVRQEVSSGLYLQSLKDVEGKVARRNLQPNRLLYLGDITDPAVVYRGQLVTVIASSSKVKITMQGMANQDGAVGDVIHVTSQTTGAVVSAVVYSPGVVVVPTRR